MSKFSDLLRKYNIPVPRYTSYPTVPYWKENVDQGEWARAFTEVYKQINAQEGISLYIHFPFCETNCTYCGCNRRVTRDHGVEEDYLQALENEWRQYLSVMYKRPLIREIHFGGGTPTFFSPENLDRLLKFLAIHSNRHPDFQLSVEGHPNNTRREHLQILYESGARRLSLGVQDNDPWVQRLINREQPFENVLEVSRIAREIGYRSVNYDLIYGLPGQSLASIQNTIRQVIAARPDRIAFYSYAHVPWTGKMQRLFDERDLPTAAEKLNLYLCGKELLLAAGYQDIGMDHFALPSDELAQLRSTGRLHRNFMGYTANPGNILLGLGVSAISDTGNAYVQNEKNLMSYYEKVNSRKWAVSRGYFPNKTDKAFKKNILDISCKGGTTIDPENLEIFKSYTLPELKEMEADGLVILDGMHVVVTTLGHRFIRNICRAFDIHLLQSGLDGERKFSMAV
jgi:oxygen-independent coproporphyrinogen-3 oxidase